MDNFEIRVDQTYRDPMSRQVNEMVRIKNFEGTLLNSKSEWNAPPIIKIVAQNETESRKRESRIKSKTTSEEIYASNQTSSIQHPPLNNQQV